MSGPTDGKQVLSCRISFPWTCGIPCSDGQPDKPSVGSTGVVQVSQHLARPCVVLCHTPQDMTVWSFLSFFGYLCRPAISIQCARVGCSRAPSNCPLRQARFQFPDESESSQIHRPHRYTIDHVTAGQIYCITAFRANVSNPINIQT